MNYSWALVAYTECLNVKQIAKNSMLNNKNQP